MNQSRGAIAGSKAKASFTMTSSPSPSTSLSGESRDRSAAETREITPKDRHQTTLNETQHIEGQPKRSAAGSHTGNNADADDDTPSFIVCDGTKTGSTAIGSRAPRTSSPISCNQQQHEPEPETEDSSVVRVTLTPGPIAVTSDQHLTNFNSKGALPGGISAGPDAALTARSENATRSPDSRTTKRHVGGAGESQLLKTVSRLKQCFGITGGCRTRDGDIDERTEVSDDNLRGKTPISSEVSSDRRGGGNSKRVLHRCNSESRIDAVGDGEHVGPPKRSVALIDESTSADCEEDKRHQRLLPGCIGVLMTIVGIEETAANRNRKQSTSDEALHTCKRGKQFERRKYVRNGTRALERSPISRTGEPEVAVNGDSAPDDVLAKSKRTIIVPGINVRIARKQFLGAAEYRRNNNGCLTDTDAETLSNDYVHSIATQEGTSGNLLYGQLSHAAVHRARNAVDGGDAADPNVYPGEYTTYRRQKHPVSDTDSSSSETVARGVMSRSSANVRRWMERNEVMMRREQQHHRAPTIHYTQQQQQHPVLPCALQHGCFQDNSGRHHMNCLHLPHRHRVSLRHNEEEVITGTCSPVNHDCFTHVTHAGQPRHDGAATHRHRRRGKSRRGNESHDASADDGAGHDYPTGNCHHRRSSTSSFLTADYQNPMTSTSLDIDEGHNRQVAALSTNSVGEDGYSSRAESTLGPSLLKFIADVIDNLENNTRVNDDGDNSSYDSDKQSINHVDRQTRSRCTSRQQTPKASRSPCEVVMPKLTSKFTRTRQRTTRQKVVEQQRQQPHHHDDRSNDGGSPWHHRRQWRKSLGDVDAVDKVSASRDPSIVTDWVTSPSEERRGQKSGVVDKNKEASNGNYAAVECGSSNDCYHHPAHPATRSTVGCGRRCNAMKMTGRLLANDANVVPAELVDSQVKPTAAHRVPAASDDLRKSVANLRQRLKLLARLRWNSGQRLQQQDPRGEVDGPSLDADDGKIIVVPELSQNFDKQQKEQCANDNVGTLRLAKAMSTELYSEMTSGIELAGRLCTDAVELLHHITRIQNDQLYQLDQLKDQLESERWQRCQAENKLRQHLNTYNEEEKTKLSCPSNSFN